jgi:hypothetical protein
MTQNIFCTGIWWATLHKDAKEQSYNICQRLGIPSRRDQMSLNPQVMMQAFDKWAIDFVGPINPQARILGARYIITAI